MNLDLAAITTYLQMIPADGMRVDHDWALWGGIPTDDYFCLFEGVALGLGLIVEDFYDHFDVIYIIGM